MDNNELIHPSQIPGTDTPLIVFSDMTSGFIEFLIKWRTKGSWNHVMWMNRKETLASQGNTYSEVPLSRYMKRGNRLKFVEILNLTTAQRELIKSSINKKLKAAWYKKLYDWVGIVGQISGLTWIQTPGLAYCSEDVPNHLKIMANYLFDDDSKKSVINAIPKHPSPQSFNDYIKQNPNTFRVYGRWESDEEPGLIFNSSYRMCFPL